MQTTPFVPFAPSYSPEARDLPPCGCTFCDAPAGDRAVTPAASQVFAAEGVTVHIGAPVCDACDDQLAGLVAEAARKRAALEANIDRTSAALRDPDGRVAGAIKLASAGTVESIHAATRVLWRYRDECKGLASDMTEVDDLAARLELADRGLYAHEDGFRTFGEALS